MVLTGCSQPFSGSPSQSSNPGAHPGLHTPPTQPAMLTLAPMHWWPQLPQFIGSVATSCSQPSLGSLLQSAKPTLQESILQVPSHLGTALSTAHTIPQLPQFI